MYQSILSSISTFFININTKPIFFYSQNMLINFLLKPLVVFQNCSCSLDSNAALSFLVHWIFTPTLSPQAFFIIYEIQPEESLVPYWWTTASKIYIFPILEKPLQEVTFSNKTILTNPISMSIFTWLKLCLSSKSYFKPHLLLKDFSQKHFNPQRSCHFLKMYYLGHHLELNSILSDRLYLAVTGPCTKMVTSLRGRMDLFFQYSIESRKLLFIYIENGSRRDGQVMIPTISTLPFLFSNRTLKY